MAKTPNKFGGGAQTNIHGLRFEQTTSLDEALVNAGYLVSNFKVYKNGRCIGMSVKKRSLYEEFLKPKGIDYTEYNSKRWEPDECLINYSNNTAYIIEKKFQNTSGSVDEKLPGCDFKKKEYEKLFTPVGYNVEFLYVLSDWFKDDRYKDTLEYVNDTGCYYFFNEIPLSFLQLH